MKEMECVVRSRAVLAATTVRTEMFQEQTDVISVGWVGC